ncbi:DMT family transporter [Thalassospira sp. MIT1370]|uniref:DMT family transporter n=1 Tax=unclassified Thalassospira TaxID=2648997 RepID=UPI00399B161C
METSQFEFSDMKKNAYIVFGFLALVWGLTYLFNKTASHYVSPMHIVMVRVTMGFVPLFLIALLRRKLAWRHLRHTHHFVVMSLLAASVYYYAFAKGIAILPSSIAGILAGAIPFFTFIAALLFLKGEPINLRSVGGLLLGFAGIAAIAPPWEGSAGAIDPAGVGYIAFGSACVGLSFVYARKFISPLCISPIALCTYQLGLSSATLLVVGDLDGIDAIFVSPLATAGLFIGLGLFGTGIAYMCYYYVVEKLGAIKAASSTYIPPVIGLATGTLILGETVTATDLVATSVILVGVIIMQSGRTPAPIASTTPAISPSPDVRAHNRPEPA